MKWIICFKESQNIGIWKIFTKNKPGFSHVFAVCYDPELDTWFKFEFATEKFNFEWNRYEEADYLVGDMVKNCTCIEIEPKSNGIALPRLLYCVSFIKHIVGIRIPPNLSLIHI